MSFSLPRLIAFAVAVGGVAATYLFLTRTYVGTAIRAISQDREIMPLMGVNPGRIFVVTSALGGALAGLSACLLVLQYDIHPAIGLSFGPITFLICVLGGLGNMLGGLVAAFIFAQFISVGGFFFAIEWGYVIAFVFFIAVMFWRPQGILGRK
jgi:branched-chain amino acid transport system permease protein